MYCRGSRWGFKGFCPLKIPTKGAALLTPALRSEGQWLPDWVVKSVFAPRDERAREDFVKVKIDVLMATYNGEKYLREQMDSILEQSYGDFRLLISDDMSTDATREILNEYVAKDSRVVVFLQNKNVGSTRNFEFLMKKVENECFMFSDQDDIWQKDKIQKSVDKMNQTDSDLVYTNLQVVSEDLEVLNQSYWRLKGFEKKVRKYNNFESLYLNNYITGSTMLVVTPTDSAKEIVQKYFPDVNIKSIEHGVEKLEYEYQRDGGQAKKNIAFLGGINKIKGVDFLKDFIEEANREDGKYIVHLFGSTCEEELNQSNGNYIYHGKYNREDVVKTLKENQIDLVVLLAIWPETYSYTLTESLMAEIPVLALDYGALSERISKYEYGWLLDRNVEFEAILKKLDAIFENEEDYEQKISNIKKYLGNLKYSK